VYIKMVLNQKECKYVDWIRLSQEKAHFSAVVNTVKDIRVP
jgi:hypothetical protein